MTSLLTLFDWRRTIAALYADVRGATDPETAWAMWRAERDRLFAEHLQSPIPTAERAGFRGLPYFEYDAALRVAARLEPATGSSITLPASSGTFNGELFASARFDLGASEHTLGVFWLEGYGGGVFVPLLDTTSGTETYGGGRYLLDSVKGADLGGQGDELILDFNFAYNPSCSYDPRWSCPLAPPSNRLDVPIRAGEKLLSKAE
ncbi:MAG TPA: DUF1684 domain-containing protein [Actinomycetota bacterium]|nr:DUF1684 domain-containing protein [Actinomycetota bacterium]